MTYIMGYSYILLLLLPLALHTWVGFDLLLRLRDSNVVYEVGSPAPSPAPKLEDQGVPCRLSHHL